MEINGIIDRYVEMQRKETEQREESDNFKPNTSIKEKIFKKLKTHITHKTHSKYTQKKKE